MSFMSSRPYKLIYDLWSFLSTQCCAVFSNLFALCLLNRYTFYDGPPFATGLPHYGHILAGTIKDIVTRFAHQNGFHVDRRFGWDCHGLPVVRGKGVVFL